MGAVAVGQDQGVFVGFVLEVVIDAFLLHEPADESKVCLPVLHAVIPGAVELAGEEVLAVSVAVIAADFPDDVRNPFLLEDATVGGAGEEPELGNRVAL